MTRREEIIANKIADEYWLDPAGKSHKFKGELDNICSVHSEIAMQILPESNDPKGALFRMGWVCMGHTVYCSAVAWKEPTQAQINALDKLGELERLMILKDRI